jgi:hypothetical protein
LIVTFDEAETSDADACCGEGPGLNSPLPGVFGTGGGRVGAVMLSPYIQPGTKSVLPYNHYSLLRSLEAIFSLGNLGLAADSGLNVLGADIFTRPAGLPAGSAPPLQPQSPLTGPGAVAGKPVVGCRAVSLPRPRKGRYARGALLASAKVQRTGSKAALVFRLTHVARVRIRLHGGVLSRRLHACNVYRLALPRHAGRVTIEARAGRGLERRVLRVR